MGFLFGIDVTFVICFVSSVLFTIVANAMSCYVYGFLNIIDHQRMYDRNGNYFEFLSYDMVKSMIKKVMSIV